MFNPLIVECADFIKTNTDISVSEAANLMYISEAEVANISNELITVLYKTALDKYRDIDFGEIPNTKGDFTKLSEYKTIMESITLLESIKTKVNVRSFDELATVTKAIENIQKYKTEFELCYKTNNDIGRMLYETIAMAIVQSTTLLIAVAVEFIKVPGEDYTTSFNNTINKKGNEFNCILIRNLENFNSACDKGTLKKLFNTILTAKGFVGADTVVALLIALGIAFTIVPLIRELIYQFFNTTMKLSKFFELQAQFVQANTYKLRMNPGRMTAKDRDKVIKEQEKLIKKFNQISSTLRGCVELADKNAKIDLKSKQNYAKVSKPKSDLDNINNNTGTVSSDLQLL